VVLSDIVYMLREVHTAMGSLHIEGNDAELLTTLRNKLGIIVNALVEKPVQQINEVSDERGERNV